MSNQKLKRGVDWHGWGWYYENDPDFGTGLEAELYDEQAQWAFPRRGRWVRVKLVAVGPVTKRTRKK